MNSETIAYLLGVAKDFRASKGLKTVPKNLQAIPQNSTECVVANAFGGEVDVEPSHSSDAKITFSNEKDAVTYCKIVGIEPQLDEYDEEISYVQPLTEELNEIAIAFDQHKLPQFEVSGGKWNEEDLVKLEAGEIKFPGYSRHGNPYDSEV